MKNRIIINPKSITYIFGSVATLLVVLSFGIQSIAITTGNHTMNRLVPFLNVDAEHNLPTYFSGLILLFASLLLALIYIFKRSRKEKDRIYWVTLSLGFIYITIDEIFVVHERIGHLLGRTFGDNATGIFRFNWLVWVIPFGVIVIILGFIFYKFWYQLPSKTKKLFMIAAIMLVGGAIGVELIEGLISDKYGKGLLLEFVCTIQESLEMFGVILFIYSLLDYIAEHYKEVYFSFEGPYNSDLESPE